MAPIDTSPLSRPPLLPSLGRLIVPLYRFEINRRNRRFDSGKGVTRLHIPVISVGNLSVGGTGKTPMVARIIHWLRDAGHDPCIAMRGYKSKKGESDEAATFKRSFDDLPIVAQADRLAGLNALFATPRGKRIDCVVLDDGFQHRKIARDLDIVLLDASRNPFEDALLPAGWLREPVSSLARADAVVVTHAEQMTTPMTRELWSPLTQSLGEHKPVALTRHEWCALDVLEDGRDREELVEWLSGRSALVVCAIGNPGAFVTRFVHAVEDGTDETPDSYAIVRPDHDPFSERTIREILALARDKSVEAIVTTDKDWSKLQRVAPDRWPCPVVRPRLELRFDRGEEELKQTILAAVHAEQPAT